MSASPSASAPRQLVAGDSVDFLVTPASDYATWAPSARLTGPSQMDATDCVTDGVSFRVRFAGQGATGTGTFKTALLPPGYYMLTVWATSGADRVTVAQYPVTITPDVSTGAPAEHRAVRMLAKVQAERERRIEGGAILDYSVENTRVLKANDAELRAMEREFARAVYLLNNPNAPIPRVQFGMAPAGNLPDLRKRFR